MRMKTILGTAALASLIAMSAQAKDVVLRIGDIVAPGSVQAQATERFAEIVNGAAAGLDVQTLHGSQLGTGPNQVENVSFGGQQMFIGGLALFGNYSDDLRIAETPFTFASRDHFERWVRSDAFGAILDEVVANGNQRIINTEVLWRRGPFRVMMATRPVLSLEDLSSVKLRLPQLEVFNRFWGKNGLGAIAVNLPFGEVYLGLRQGVVDAVTTPFDLVPSMKFGEVAKHVMDLKPFWQILPISINEDVWQSLDADQQALLVDAANQAGEYYNQQISDKVDVWRDQLKKMGVTWHEVDRAPFVERIRERNLEWAKDGYWSAGLIEGIEALRTE